MITRRSSFAVFAASIMAPLGAAFAQAPAGGVSSTTAPSNSEGTPAGGSGDIGGTRVKSRAKTARKHRTRRTRHSSGQ